MYNTNTAIWSGIDKCAAEHGLSCCRMAKQCGLNSTVFNPSKRTTKYQQQRWLSTETIEKISNHFGIDIHDFFNMYVPRQKQKQ